MTSIAPTVTIPRFARVTEKPWGFELCLTPGSLPYAAKILHVSAGQRLSLQTHDVKIETMTLISGRAILTLEDEQGLLVSIDMVPNVGYTVYPGQRHRVSAQTDCQIAESSTPEVGITRRLEDDYGRKSETEAEREPPILSTAAFESSNTNGSRR